MCSGFRVLIGVTCGDAILTFRIFKDLGGAATWARLPEAWDERGSSVFYKPGALGFLAYGSFRILGGTLFLGLSYPEGSYYLGFYIRVP